MLFISYTFKILSKIIFVFIEQALLPVLKLFRNWFKVILDVSNYFNKHIHKHLTVLSVWNLKNDEYLKISLHQLDVDTS